MTESGILQETVAPYARVREANLSGDRAWAMRTRTIAWSGALVLLGTRKKIGQLQPLSNRKGPSSKPLLLGGIPTPLKK